MRWWGWTSARPPRRANSYLRRTRWNRRRGRDEPNWELLLRDAVTSPWPQLPAPTGRSIRYDVPRVVARWSAFTPMGICREGYAPHQGFGEALFAIGSNIDTLTEVAMAAEGAISLLHSRGVQELHKGFALGSFIRLLGSTSWANSPTHCHPRALQHSRWSRWPWTRRPRTTHKHYRSCRTTPTRLAA